MTEQNYNIDVQCKQILDGLKQLDECLSERITYDALDLEVNSQTSRYKELLTRIKRSLIQYTDRGKDIVYIGFMGHFSSGKSSTINSLLNLDDSSEEHRQTGLNPVDKTITLITHGENKSSIITITQEGMVPIRSSFIDKEFLRNIAIADTPGTGDPVLDNAIAKDFLPICDLILYFFSATSPLDSADRLILEEKISQLPFIPLRFVVTRADEFRADYNASFSDENFDLGKASVFIGEIVQRINHLFRNSNLNIIPSDIFLVDNLAKFRVVDLRNYILSFSNTSNAEGQIRIHSHKVAYYRNSSERLKSFFSTFLDEKVKAISSFVATATENIRRFNDEIQITNNSLTETWAKEHKLIQEKKLNVLKKFPEEMLILKSPDKIWRQMPENGRIRMDINSKASEEVSNLKKKIKQEVLEIIQPELSAFKRKINSASLQDLQNPGSLLLKLPDIQSVHIRAVSESIYPPDSLYIDLQKFYKEIQDELNTSRESLEKYLKSLINIISKQEPIQEHEEILNISASKLAQDFDKFFKIITIYRSGIFSLNVKKEISKLGLGGKLDELESDELPDIEKVTIKNKAKDSVFPEMSNHFSKFKREATLLEEKSIQLLTKVDQIKQVNLVTSRQDLDPKIKKEERVMLASREVGERIISDANEFLQTLKSKIQSSIDESYSNWNTQYVGLQKDRRRYFMNVFGFSFTIGLLLWVIILKFANINLPDNLLLGFGVGIITNLITDFIALLGAKSFETFPKQVRLNETNILSNLRANCLEIIEIESEKFNGEPSDSDLRYYCERIGRLWQTLLLDEILKLWIEEEGDKFSEDLEELIQKYSVHRNDYLNNVNEVTAHASAYLSNPSENLERLRAISDDLKDRSVNPSFLLLEQTRDQLERVREKIENIKFF